MNDKDKLRAEILQEFKAQGDNDRLYPMYEKIIQIIQNELHAPIPERVITQIRNASARKPKTVNIFNLFTRVAVAVIAFLLMLGVVMFEFYKPNIPESNDVILIASSDSAFTKNIDGVEYIADKETKLVKKSDFMDLEKGEIIVNSYNIPDNMNFQIQKMNVVLLPGSIALFQNCGNVSQVAIFKGQAKVTVDNQTQNLDANSDRKILYHEIDTISQPVEGSPEKYAELRHKAKVQAKKLNSTNTNGWINQNETLNLRIDKFIWSATKKKSLLVKRVSFSEDSNKCAVIFKIDKEEKLFDIKKGANIGSWIVTDLTKSGFKLHDGKNKIEFTYAN